MVTTIQATFGNVTCDGAAFGRAKAGSFGGHMMSILTWSLLSSIVDIGHRTGCSRPPPRVR